ARQILRGEWPPGDHGPRQTCGRGRVQGGFRPSHAAQGHLRDLHPQIAPGWSRDPHGAGPVTGAGSETLSYLLDTNVISELVRPKPSARVLRWFGGVPDAALHLSVLSLGEIRKGVERVAEGPRKAR